MSWLPTLNNDVLHLSTSLSIQMASIMSASIALGRFFAGVLFRKIDWLFVLTGCLLAAAALVLVTVPHMRQVSVTRINSLTDVPLVANTVTLMSAKLTPTVANNNFVIIKLGVEGIMRHITVTSANAVSIAFL